MKTQVVSIVRGQYWWKGTERTPEQSVGHWAIMVNAADRAEVAERVNAYWTARQRRVTNVTVTTLTLEVGAIVDLAGGDFLLGIGTSATNL